MPALLVDRVLYGILPLHSEVERLAPKTLHWAVVRVVSYAEPNERVEGNSLHLSEKVACRRSCPALPGRYLGLVGEAAGACLRYF